MVGCKHDAAAEGISPGIRVDEQGQHREQDRKDELDHGDEAMAPAEQHLLYKHPVKVGPPQSPSRQLHVVVVES